MNLASLSTLDANDPLPLALGPQHEPPVPAPKPDSFRVVDNKILVVNGETGQMTCRPTELGPHMTFTDFTNRNPYAKRPSSMVETALNLMRAMLDDESRRY